MTILKSENWLRKPHVKATSVGIAVATILATPMTVWASAYNLHELSARHMGTAGVGQAAATEDASTAYFNPANSVHVEGDQFSGNLTFLWLKADAEASSTVAGGSDGGSDFMKDPLLPALYYVKEVASDFSLGVSLNTPFGLVLDYPDDWAGRLLVTYADIKTMALTTTGSYRVNDMLSIGAGPIIQYSRVKLNAKTGAGGDIKRDWDDWGLGFAAGVTLTPKEGTRLGLSYRHNPNHDYSGDRSGTTNETSSLKWNWPDTAVMSLEQKLGSEIDLFADVGWAGWSSIGDVQTIVETTSGDTNVKREWKDSWRFGIGGQYKLDPTWKLRMGVSYDQNANTANRRFPDSPFDDQWRYGLGANYTVSEKVNLDFGYTFLDLGDNRVDLATADYGADLAGTMDAFGHAIAIQLNYKF